MLKCGEGKESRNGRCLWTHKSLVCKVKGGLYWIPEKRMCKCKTAKNWNPTSKRCKDDPLWNDKQAKKKAEKFLKEAKEEEMQKY